MFVVENCWRFKCLQTFVTSSKNTKVVFAYTFEHENTQMQVKEKSIQASHSNVLKQLGAKFQNVQIDNRVIGIMCEAHMQMMLHMSLLHRSFSFLSHVSLVRYLILMPSISIFFSVHLCNFCVFRKKTLLFVFLFLKSGSLQALLVLCCCGKKRALKVEICKRQFCF